MPEHGDSTERTRGLALDDTVGDVFRAAGGAEPVRHHAAVVRAVVPCFNRPGDLDLLLADLDVLDLSTGAGEIRLDVVVIDNASEPPLHPARLPTAVPVRIVRLTSNTGGSGGFNAGMTRVLSEPWGSDVGVADEFLWLIDSDVRLRTTTLVELVGAMRARRDVVVAGAAIADVANGEVFEVGGEVARRTGVYGAAGRGVDTRTADGGRGEPEKNGRPGGGEIVECDYVASACALVRRSAVERVGLMPDRFLNGDDVEWCIRLAIQTGGVVAAVPAAVALHPRFDRFPTVLRYYGARSSMGPLAALGLSRRVRLRRALVETGRAINQTMMGRDDLAAMHLSGLHDALTGRTTGPAPREAVKFEKFRPWAELEGALRQIAETPTVAGRAPRVTVSPGTALPERAAVAVEQAISGVTKGTGAAGGPAVVGRGAPRVREEEGARAGGVIGGVLGAVVRALAVKRADIAVVPAEGRPGSWFAGRWMVEVVPDGFVVRRVHRVPVLGQALRALVAGVGLALRAGLTRGRVEPLPPAHEPVHRSLTTVVHAAASMTAAVIGARALTVTAVILSYNRREALARTLAEMSRCRARPGQGSAGVADAPDAGPLDAERAVDLRETVVVDNGSTDGTVEFLRERFASVRLVALPRNLGVEAFNRGVAAASGDLVLILDDDSWVEPGPLAAAVELLERRPELAAVTFEPKHPRTHATEWKAAAGVVPGGTDRWPMMGCANLVRRDDWMAVRGYERAYFLYRNDSDLALKLLGAGRGVHFNPEWWAWHDSPAAARKSRRWFRLATRNWVWMARRHGRGARKWLGALAGWAWAHRLAGRDLRCQFAALAGGVSGVFKRAPSLPSTVRPTGRDWAELLRLQLSRRGASAGRGESGGRGESSGG